MLNAVFWGVEQAQQAICGLIPCVEQTLFPRSGLPHSWGWIFGVFVGREVVPRGNRRFPVLQRPSPCF